MRFETFAWSRTLAAAACLSLSGFFASCSSNSTAPADSSPVVETTQTVVGEMEMLTLTATGHSYPARIDSGATTCSLHATDIKRFERDGKKWVRFTVKADGKLEATTIEKPISRIAYIKRHGAEDQERPAVKLPIKMGPIEDTIEFTLTDRSKYTFPVLVGRNLLSGNALVDVSRRYNLGSAPKEGASSK